MKGRCLKIPRKHIKIIFIVIVLLQFFWIYYWQIHFNKGSESEKPKEFTTFEKENPNENFNGEKKKEIEKKEENEQSQYISNEEFQEKMQGIKGSLLFMVGWRPEVLKEVLYSVSELREKSGFVLLSSHDGRNKPSEDLIDSFAASNTDEEGFEGVIRVLNVYREVYLSMFDKDNNPAYFTKALKNHWMFAMKFAFDVLNLPFVLYLEDDVILSPDLLVALKELLKNRERLCDDPNCFIITGCHGDCWKTKADDPKKVVYFPGPGNIGTVIFKSHFQKIKENSELFCNSIEDNWDITLKEFLKKKLFPPKSLTLSLSRWTHLSSGSIRGEMENKYDVTKQRIDILNRYKRLGLDTDSIDLSNLRKEDLKRAGPHFETYSPIRQCERKYSKLCNFIGSNDLVVEKWKKEGNLYIPQFKPLKIDIPSLTKKKDDCHEK